MKTKVRITHTSLSGNSLDGEGYKHLIIEVLDRRYKGIDDHKKYPTLEAIGLIQWQGHYAGGDNLRPSGWYGPHVEVKAGVRGEDKLLKMYKIMKYLLERAEVELPKEYLYIMDAEEHVYDRELGNFLPLSANGMKVFELFQVK